MLNIEQNMVPAISHVLSSLAIVCYSRIEYNLQHAIRHFWENFQRHMGMMRCGRESCTLCTFIDSIACKSFKNIPFASMLWSIEARNHKYLFFTLNTHKLHLSAEMKRHELNNWWYTCLFGDFLIGRLLFDEICTMYECVELL